jgi:Tfp pilus assembly protein PilN
VIHTNLATRPDRGNQRFAGRLSLAAGAAVLATIVNGVSVVYYMRSDTQLKAQAAQHEARAAEQRRAAARLRSTIAATDSGAVAADVAQARELIARRAFSWTELFNRFEATLPAGVRLTSVRPGVGGTDGIVLEVSVIARSVDDLDRFLRDLEGTGSFDRVLARDERRNEQGQIEALIETAYTTTAPTSAAGSRTP